MFNKEVISYENKVYWVYRRFISSKLNESKLPDLTSFWECDLHLKTSVGDGVSEYFFLKVIPEAEIIE